MNASTVFRVTTINLNGIRAARRRGFHEWLEEHQPDVLLMQEVRAEPEVAEEALGEMWESHFNASRLKGRAGVGIAVRKDSPQVAMRTGSEVLKGLDEGESDVDSGRWIEAEIETATGTAVRLASAYFHAGELGSEKQERKMAHLEALSARLTQLLRASLEDQGAHSLVAGDFNVVRGESDLKNWKPNHNRRSGALDQEIAYLNDWVSQGWVDTVRELAGPRQGPYSWWSWRGKAFDNDAGWRIDYHYATPALGAGAKNYSIFRAPSWDTRFSDHAPVTVDYRI